MSKLTEAIRFAIDRAARLLTGAKKRKYMAEITLAFVEGNTRPAERELGWGRATIEKGLRELGRELSVWIITLPVATNREKKNFLIWHKIFAS